ncbi:MAG: 5-dehydro-2-deoxygluconokinase [Aggregatilineales bacterium]
MTEFDLICIGRSSLDLFAENIGATFADVTGFKAFVGGSPTNVCVMAGRLGLKTAMITGLGDDYTRDFILKFLYEEGVSTDYITLKRGMQTNTVMVALEPPTDMQFVALHANNADLALTIDDMHKAPLATSRALLFSGMCLMQEPSRSATQAAAETARNGGAIVLMDLDYRVPMWSDARIYGITTRLTLNLVDIVLGTEEEVMAAASATDLDVAIERLKNIAHSAVIVKKGERGAEAHLKNGEVISVPAFKVDVVNFLGAGDAFAGAFAYAHLNGWDWGRALTFANAAGALIVSRHGTANAMPTLAEIDALIGQP